MAKQPKKTWITWEAVIFDDKGEDDGGSSFSTRAEAVQYIKDRPLHDYFLYKATWEKARMKGLAR